MRAIVLGKEVLGATDPPLNRRSGVDRVDATLGDYRDASAKGNLVHLLATESNGALSPAVVLLLHALAKFTHDAQGHDPTPYYGLGRASPRSFFPHRTNLPPFPQPSSAPTLLRFVTTRPPWHSPWPTASSK